MDYEGKYFPDEDEEELSQSKKRRKKITKYIFYGIVALVYIVSFFILFSNCESDLYEEINFSEKAKKIYEEDPESFVVYEVHPQIFMNYLGSVQIDGVAYTPTANELELGIKFNKKLITDGKEPRFLITDTNGNNYEVCSVITDEKGRYKYMRISYADIKLNLDENVYTNPNFKEAAEGEGEAFDTVKYTLIIEYSDGTESESIDIFNSKTAIELTEYS